MMDEKPSYAVKLGILSRHWQGQGAGMRDSEKIAALFEIKKSNHSIPSTGAGLINLPGAKPCQALRLNADWEHGQHPYLSPYTALPSRNPFSYLKMNCRNSRFLRA